MKKYVDGKYIEMTAEEIAEMQVEEITPTMPTMEERIEAIEAAILEGVLMSD